MDLIVTLQCKDQPGIVHAMTAAVLAAQGNIIENQQYTDPTTQIFVMRTRFESTIEIVKVREFLENGLGHLKPKLSLRSVVKQKRQ